MKSAILLVDEGDIQFLALLLTFLAQRQTGRAFPGFAAQSSVNLAPTNTTANMVRQGKKANTFDLAIKRILVLGSTGRRSGRFAFGALRTGYQSRSVRQTTKWSCVKAPVPITSGHNHHIRSQ